MQRKTAVLLAALLLTPTAAYAQHNGTQAEQDACTPDVFRLCQDFIPDEGAIVACLKTKRPQLSSACGSVMFPQSENAAATQADGPAPRKVRHKRKKKHKARPHV